MKSTGVWLIKNLKSTYYGDIDSALVACDTLEDAKKLARKVWKMNYLNASLHFEKVGLVFESLKDTIILESINGA